MLADDNDLYLPREALCTQHNTTYNSGLGFCPECMEEVRP